MGSGTSGICFQKSARNWELCNVVPELRERVGWESGEEPRVKWRRGECCAETGQSLAVSSDDGDQRWADISNYAHSSLYFSARDLHLFHPFRIIPLLSKTLILFYFLISIAFHFYSKIIYTRLYMCIYIKWLR